MASSSAPEGKLRAARDRFLRCSATTCPAIVRSDCAKWASEVLDQIPTIVVDAHDSSGRDLTNVKVIVDGGAVATELDGRALAIDPGPHEIRFEHEGYPPSAQKILAKEGIKGRRLTVSFGPSGSPETSAAAPTPPAESARGHTIYPWILIGAGGAFMLGGVAVLLTAPAFPDNCDAETQTCTPEPGQTSADFEATQETAGRARYQPRIGLLVAGTGAAIALGGLVWHLLEPTGPKSAARFVPVVTATHGGAAVVGTF